MCNYNDLIDNDDDDYYSMTDYRHINEIRVNPKFILFVFSVGSSIILYNMFIKYI